jgi:TonB family protein
VLLWSRGGDTEERRAPAVSAADRVERLYAAGEASIAAEVDSVAAPLGAPGLGVVYPPDLFAASVGGTVLVEFVVDTTGRVEGDTFGVVSSPHLLLSHAVYQAVERATFSPGRRQGRAVRQIVQMQFRFDPPKRGQ